MTIKNNTTLRQLGQIFVLFFKIGLVTFGGGVTMAPILMREVVEKRGWLSAEDLVEGFALAQSLPGIVAVNAAVFVGQRIKGLTGAAAAAIASILPAIIGILALTAILDALPLRELLNQGLTGVKSASVALILCTVIRMVKSVLTAKLDIILFAAACIACVCFDLSAILLVLSFILLGALHYLTVYLMRKRKEKDA